MRLVADRLGRLTPAATALARAVAVLGADADAPRARALAEPRARVAADAEEELRGERVLDTRTYAFTHPLVATAAREGMRTALARELHERAAALLADGGVDDQRLAEHLMRAPPRGDDAVVATLRRAAEAARRLGGSATAARLLERARAEPPAPEDLDAIDFERGRSLLDAGEEAGASVLVRLARGAPDASVRVDAARHLAQRFGLRGRGPEAVAVLRAVVESLPDTHRELRLELLVELTFIGGSDLGGLEEAAHTIAAAAARAAGRTPGERLVSVAAGVMRAQTEIPSDAVGAARELLALRLYRDYPGGFAVGALTFAATAMLMNADALDDAERAMDVLRADAEAMALPDLIAGAMWQQAQIAYQRGDLPRCELEGRGAIEAGGDFARRLATPWLVMALAEQNRLDEAEQLLGSADMLGPIPPSILLTAALGSRGRLRLAQGDPARAVEDLADVRDRNAAWHQQRVEPPWLPLLTEALVLADRRREAADEAETYAKLAAGWGTRRALGHAARMRARRPPRARRSSCWTRHEGISRPATRGSSSRAA